MIGTRKYRRDLGISMASWVQARIEQRTYYTTHLAEKAVEANSQMMVAFRRKDKTLESPCIGALVVLGCLSRVHFATPSAHFP